MSLCVCGCLCVCVPVCNVIPPPPPPLHTGHLQPGDPPAQCPHCRSHAGLLDRILAPRRRMCFPTEKMPLLFLYPGREADLLQGGSAPHPCHHEGRGLTRHGARIQGLAGYYLSQGFNFSFVYLALAGCHALCRGHAAFPCYCEGRVRV